MKHTGQVQLQAKNGIQTVTAQLDDLSINLVQGPRAQPLPHNEERMQETQPVQRPPPRRQEHTCWNCGEDGHGMYFCPHPRRYFGHGQGRGPRRQVTLPRDKPRAPVQPPPAEVEQPQILRRPPQAAAVILPLPEEAGERAVNVIHLESKGKENVEEPEVMPVE